MSSHIILQTLNSNLLSFSLSWGTYGSSFCCISAPPYARICKLPCLHVELHYPITHFIKTKLLWNTHHELRLWNKYRRYFYYKLFFRKEWKMGCIKADAQNVARRLMDMPSNKMTPLMFANVSFRKKIDEKFENSSLFEQCGKELLNHLYCSWFF